DDHALRVRQAEAARVGGHERAAHGRHRLARGVQGARLEGEGEGGGRAVPPGERRDGLAGFPQRGRVGQRPGDGESGGNREGGEERADREPGHDGITYECGTPVSGPPGDPERRPRRAFLSLVMTWIISPPGTKSPKS